MIGTAVIAGAGIGGLCAAAGLDRAGWSVTIVERWPRIVPIGAGLGVWPDAQRALDGFGVGDRLRDRAVRFGSSSLFDKDGRRLCAVPSARVERRAACPIRILPRSELIPILVDATAGCRVLTDVDIADRPDLTGSADVVIGADGLRSTVRRTFFPDQAAAPRDTAMIAWRGTVARELDDDAYGETWGDGALFGLTRLAPGRTNWYAAVPAGPGGTADFATVVDRFRAWRTPIPAVLADTDPTGVLHHRIEDLDPHLTSYVEGRVALLGDAAHAMTPNLGRGACEAILDAAQLVAGLTAATDPAEALRGYDLARRPVTRRVVQRSRRALTIATLRRTGLRNGALRLASPLIR